MCPRLAGGGSYDRLVEEKTHWSWEVGSLERGGGELLVSLG